MSNWVALAASMEVALPRCCSTLRHAVCPGPSQGRRDCTWILDLISLALDVGDQVRGFVILNESESEHFLSVEMSGPAAHAR